MAVDNWRRSPCSVIIRNILDRLDGVKINLIGGCDLTTPMNYLGVAFLIY